VTVAVRNVKGKPDRVIDTQVHFHLFRACHDPAHILQVIEREERAGLHGVECDEFVLAEREFDVIGVPLRLHVEGHGVGIDPESDLVGDDGSRFDGVVQRIPTEDCLAGEVDRWSGHFFEEWTNGGESWERIMITAHDCPRISPEFLEEERQALGDWWFRQEYLCEFVETVDQVFSYDLVQAAITEEVKPLFGGAEGE